MGILVDLVDVFTVLLIFPYGTKEKRQRGHNKQIPLAHKLPYVYSSTGSFLKFKFPLHQVTGLQQHILSKVIVLHKTPKLMCYTSPTYFATQHTPIFFYSVTKHTPSYCATQHTRSCFTLLTHTIP